MKSFDCYFAMYLHHRGVKSSVYGENLIDAIKKRNQHAILVKVFDEDGTEYIVKEHDKESPDNYYDHYWVDKNGKVLYDEKEDKWGYYYQKKRERKKVKKRKPIINNDLKVRVVAYDGKLLIIPNKPFENVDEDWYPVNEKGRIGSSVAYSKKNLGISKKALKLMRTIKNGGDGIGDIDWYKMDNDSYTFSWLCALYRVIDPKDSVGARGFYVRPNECQIIKNVVTDEMINGVKTYDGYRWKGPFSVTDNNIKKYNRKKKLEKLNGCSNF